MTGARHGSAGVPVGHVVVVHERDPDSSCTLRVFVGGVEVRDVDEVTVDPGAGYSREDWDAGRAFDEARHAGSPRVLDAVRAAYDAADGSEYLT